MYHTLELLDLANYSSSFKMPGAWLKGSETLTDLNQGEKNPTGK